MSDEPPRPFSASQLTLVVLIVALAAGSLLYRALYLARLEQTSALYIGVPALLAIILALTPRVKSPLAMVMKGTTLALLMSGVLLGEGFL